MIFKMYNCDFVLTVNEVNYKFDHVDSVTIEDPESTKLTRGSNASNKVGLEYTEGTKDPKRVTLTLLGVSAAINTMLKNAYQAKSRVEFSVVDRGDGSGIIAKSAIISQMPRQLTVDESPESMNVPVIFETFDLSETHKS